MKQFNTRFPEIRVVTIVISMLMICFFSSLTTNLQAMNNREQNRLITESTQLAVYQNPDFSIDERVNDLLQRMTLAEKVALVSGDGFTTKRNVRLGIPEIVMTDGPMGPHGKGKATNYSSCLNMAATWDDSLMQRVGVSLGEETRVLGFNMLLGPCINIARVPHGGRTFESFGEDPYLMSRMAVAYIKGVQSQRVIACAKHFAVNNQEWNRGVVDVNVDDRTLNEIYFPAFKASIQEAGVGSIMAAYNQFRGAYCCSNRYLLTEILRKEWDFEGFVVSDWGGVHNTLQTARSGLDLEMPEGQFLGDSLMQAIESGLLPADIVDDNVRRILHVMFEFGLFDESVRSYGGYANTRERRDLALEVAQNSIVLLKNENNILPLDKKNIHSIAVIGPNADQARLYGGGSGILPAHYSISPLQGLENKIGKDKIRFVKAGRLKQESLPAIKAALLTPPNAKPGQQGLLGEYFNNRELEGNPVLTRIDKTVDFSWESDSPAPGVVNNDRFSARWTGTFTSPGSGVFELGIKSDNGCRLYLDGKCVIDSWIVDKASTLRSIYIELEKGRQYNVRMEFFENIGTCEAHLGLDYYGKGNELPRAIAAAKESDFAIICAGLRETLEGEGNDRDDLALPDDQIELIQAVTKANPKTIVVLFNATPVLMNDWINKVPAVVEAFYPGQEGGHALADILFGDVNPSGKLPLTFIKQWKDSPVYPTYPGAQDSVTYTEGLYVGYRHFDKQGIDPLFPFGHGLSYTTFSYRDLEIDTSNIDSNGKLFVKLDVQNSGQRPGKEIVQLYVQDPESSVEREVKALKRYAKVSLDPNETKTVTFCLEKPDFGFYDATSRKWVAEPGLFNVMIGSSSRDIRLQDEFELK